MKTMLFEGQPKKVLVGNPESDYKQWVLEPISWTDWFLSKIGFR